MGGGAGRRVRFPGGGTAAKSGQSKSLASDEIKKWSRQVQTVKSL